MKKILITALVVAAAIVTTIIITKKDTQPDYINNSDANMGMPIQGSDVDEMEIDSLESDKNGDPSANKYDFGADAAVDENGDTASVERQRADVIVEDVTLDKAAAEGDPIPGIGITEEQSGSGSR